MSPSLLGMKKTVGLMWPAVLFWWVYLEARGKYARRGRAVPVCGAEMVRCPQISNSRFSIIAT